MATVTNYLGPEEINAYQTRINQADTAYNRGLAKLAYQRSIGAQDYGTNQARFQRKWDTGLKNLPSAFIRRGVGRSGIFRQGLDDYAYARQQDQYDMDLLNSRRADAFTQQKDDMDLVRQFALQQIEAERAARQAALAAQIQGVQ